MPVFAVFLTIVALSSIGVPGTNGFIGEFLVLIGSYKTMPFHAVIAATSVIFAAAYLLWAVQRIIYNPLVKPENQALKGMDLNWREIGLLVPLVAGILWIGVYPKPVLEKTEAAATRLVRIIDRHSSRPRWSHPMTYDLSIPSQLAAALLPDILLIVARRCSCSSPPGRTSRWPTSARWRRRPRGPGHHAPRDDQVRA